MSRSIRELAIEVSAVSNAGNLCGVAQSFAKAMIDLSPHCNSTQERNTHFITKAWLSVLTDLADMNVSTQKCWALIGGVLAKP